VRFAEVEAALFANPYQRIWGGRQASRRCPCTQVTLRNMLRGILPGGRAYAFSPGLPNGPSTRTPTCGWGPDRKGFPPHRSSQMESA